MGSCDALDREPHHTQIISTVLSSETLDHVFQPLRELASDQIVGFESFARFDDGTPPAMAWKTAITMGRGRDLDVLSVRTAIYQARGLPGLLFVNVHPAHLSLSGKISGGVGLIISRFRQREAIVFELVATPGGEIDSEAACDGVERLRKGGIYMSLDDGGTEMVTLEELAWLKPTFVKLNRQLTYNAYHHGHTSLLREWVRRSHAMEATVIAEGVEDPRWGPWLRSLGVDWVQGHAYGPPNSAHYWASRLKSQEDPGRAVSYFCPPGWDHFRESVAFTPLDAREMGELLYADLPLALWVVDDEGRLAGMNQRAEEFWHVAPATALGRPVETALGFRRMVPEVSEDVRESSFRQFRVEKTNGSEQSISLTVLSVQKRGRNYSVMIVRNSSVSVGLPPRFGTDPLTGLASRIWWQGEEKHLTTSGVVAFLDVDGLKAVNDLFGHAAGDRLLKTIGSRIRQRLQAGMFAVRYGGDEFLVVWPGGNREAAQAWVEGLANSSLVQRDDVVPIRFSFGVAAFEAGQIETAIIAADRRLLEMKRFRLPTDAGAALILTGTGRRTLWEPSMIAPEVAEIDAAYDDIISGIYPEPEAQAREFVDWIDPQAGSAVVEVGGGTGRLALAGNMIERVGSGGQYLITDISAVYLSQAFRHIHPKWSWVHCQVAPASDLPVISGCVDLAFGAFFLFDCHPDPVFSELRRILRPKGRLALAEVQSWQWSSAWQSLWRTASQGKSPSQTQIANVTMLAQREGLQLIRQKTQQVTLTFPNRDWALSFAVRSALWRQRGPHAEPGPILPRLREELSRFELEDLSIPVTIGYYLWQKPQDGIELAFCDRGTTNL